MQEFGMFSVIRGVDEIRRKMRLFLQALACVVVLFPGAPDRALAQSLRQLLDLRGHWKFEIGDDTLWADAGFDDRRWESIAVPSAWEDQGFPGYDGYGWYRKHFQVPPEWKGRSLYILLGHIDDVDEVYVNGRFIAFMGTFPPNYGTAYNIPRRYYLPAEVLNFSGENVVAVRVYDHELTGGIVHGSIGIFEDRDVLVPDYSLTGAWRFSPGDNHRWAAGDFDDSQWADIRVPAYWETQGFKGLDGFGWYRKRFRPPVSLTGRTVILLVGRIDDFDEVYLNDELIGKTGRMPPREDVFGTTEYMQVRAYTVPAGRLRAEQENVLAVRVYDGFLHGGIYEGPVGIVPRDRFLSWEGRQSKGWRDAIERLLDVLFR